MTEMSPRDKSLLFWIVLVTVATLIWRLSSSFQS